MIKKLQSKHILEYIREFYEILFKKTGTQNCDRNGKFFSEIDIAKLSENQRKLCEEYLTDKDFYNSLKSMQNEFPGKDGLTK